jgi:alternate signal-mediated exported protein
MKRFKNKKSLAIAGVAVAILAIAGTIAYNQDSMFFANLFHVGSDMSEFTEVFESPDNWSPCTETPKTAIATNKNSTPRYVRMKITEYWRTANSTTPESDHETTDLPLTWNDEGTEKHYAVINTQNDEKWSLAGDGWYYYDHALTENESTLSLLKSVTFNCEVNTVGEFRYSVDGKSGESVPNEYAGAKYHLYITFQMSAEPLGPEGHIANCDHPTELYDIIACLTNGPDSELNFSSVATGATNDDGTFTGTNGFGVNTVDAHKNDEYPVYYYRGNVATNHVLFGENCWSIVRTTSTGGVKLLFDGKTSTNSCAQDYDSRNNYYYPYISGNFSPIFSTTSDNNFQYFGYMYGNSSDYSNHRTEEFHYFSPNSTTYFGKGVEWNGSSYELTDYIEVTASNYESKLPEIYSKYHYRCMDAFSRQNCSQVYYVYMQNVFGNYRVNGSDPFRALLLKNGEKYEDVIGHSLNNINSSSIKTKIENWYANGDSYTIGTLSSNQSKLEDAVFCSDTTLTNTAIKDPNTDVSKEMALYLGAAKRLTVPSLTGVGSVQPSVDCAKSRDSYTANAANGNGALDYPVGLRTADEVVYAGATPFKTLLDDYSDTNAISNETNQKSYVYFGVVSDYNNIWTMTPALSNNMAFRWYAYSSRGYLRPFSYMNSSEIRPVVSLKPGTVVSSGNGSAATPYVIE